MIAHRGHQLHGGQLDDLQLFLSPNDDVNKSQSTNDIFPTGMRIAATKVILEKTVPALERMMETYRE